jgi:putative tributyrin esterase
MALMRIQFFGRSIQKQTNMTVIVPDECEEGGPYPVYYLLHGLSDDDSIWTRRTSLERYVAGMPLIVVMPDGGRGFYTNAERGSEFESHIMSDVVGFVDRFFPTVRRREGRAIGGLSMGGYGSMKLALKFPGMFASVAAHSSAFDVASRVADAERSDEFRLIFGDRPEGGPEDPYQLAAQVDRSLLPAIRFDCGTEDRLIAENRRFHEHLSGMGIEHEYEEFPGGHEWSYWDERVREALAFHGRALGIGSSGAP